MARVPIVGDIIGTEGRQLILAVDANDNVTLIDEQGTPFNLGSGGGGSGTVTQIGSFTIGDVIGATNGSGSMIKSLGQPAALVYGLLSGTAGVTFLNGVFSLAAPSTTVLGGVRAATAPANQFQTGISVTGAPTFAQPSFGSLSGTIATNQFPPIITAGSYSNANVTIDATGRVTAIANGTGGGTSYTLPAATTGALGGVKIGTATTGQFVNGVAADGTLTYATPAGATGSNRYDVSSYIEGPPTAGERLLLFYAPVAFTIAAGLSGSQAHALTAAAASAVFSVNKNGTSFGTITFAAGGTTGTLAASTSTSFTVGDRLEIIAPATADTALADLSFTLAGTF